MPRDSQKGRVLKAIEMCAYPLHYAPLDEELRRLARKSLSAASVRRLVGASVPVPPVWVGRCHLATADGIQLKAREPHVARVFALSLLARHIALTHHPADEPLHGWRYAKLLLTMVEACGGSGLGVLKDAFRVLKVKHKAPRKCQPASPAERKRLEGLRILHAMDKMFGEAAKTHFGSGHDVQVPK